MIQPISFYDDAVKRTLILHYTQFFLNAEKPDVFVDTLSRLFRLKKKLIRNIALYVKNEVETKGHPLDISLTNVGFFAYTFTKRIDINNGQPFHRCFQY